MMGMKARNFSPLRLAGLHGVPSKSGASRANMTLIPATTSTTFAPPVVMSSISRASFLRRFRVWSLATTEPVPKPLLSLRVARFATEFGRGSRDHRPLARRL